MIYIYMIVAHVNVRHARSRVVWLTETMPAVALVLYIPRGTTYHPGQAKLAQPGRAGLCLCQGNIPAMGKVDKTTTPDLGLSQDVGTILFGTFP